MKIKIAQVKINPEKGNLENNHKRLMAVLAEISPSRPDVVITPECFLDGYIVTEETIDREGLLAYAVDPEDSPYVEAVKKWARDNNSWVVFGCTRKSEAGAHNTALIINRSGELAGLYDKTHCQSHDKKFVAGNVLPVFASDFGTFGVLICADRRWPETVRTLALKGARVIFNPTYGMHNEMNYCMMRTRSFENEIFIAFTHALQSIITSPYGEVLKNEEREEITHAITEIDLSEVMEKRKKRSHVLDRRPEIYAS